MTGPNPNAPLNVLICDGQEPEAWAPEPKKKRATIKAVRHMAAELQVNLDIERVTNLEQMVNAFSAKKVPHFAMVAIAGHHITDSNPPVMEKGGMKIHTISNKDPYVPIVVYGKEISRHGLGRVTRRGARYVPQTVNQLIYNAQRFFKDFKEPLPSRKRSVINNPVVVKKGGSGLDYSEQNPHVYNLKIIGDCLKRIRKLDRGRRVPKFRIISTTGAGPAGERLKDNLKRHPNEYAPMYARLAANALKNNLLDLYVMMGKKDFFMVEPEDFYFINDRIAGRPILTALAPHYILARDGIPLEDSDTHTVAIAEAVRAKRIVLIKRTDGIYKFDPNYGHVFADPKRKEGGLLQQWITAQKNNKRYDIAKVQDFLTKKISTEGTNLYGQMDQSLGHLMEKSALEYFANCKHVKEILVVHIAPDEMFYKVHPKKEIYQHVIEGYTMKLGNEGWPGYIFASLLNAFNGLAKSKIVNS